MSENVGAPTSRNPKGLHGLYRDSLIFLCNTKPKLISVYILAEALASLPVSPKRRVIREVVKIKHIRFVRETVAFVFTRMGSSPKGTHLNLTVAD
jgi:hypothetical protein